MTDEELVKRLRANASWGDDRFAEAADRIEQLVATNEQLTEELSACTESPGGCGYWRERSKALTKERDRMREALGLDPWFVGRDAWKKYVSIALKEELEKNG